MARKSIYLETTVVSFYTARPPREVALLAHQASVHDLWERLDEFDVFISEIVYSEVAAGDPDASSRRRRAIEEFAMLLLDEPARDLASSLLAGSAIPPQHPDDALHLAIAAANSIDVLVTLNFRHLNNPRTRVEARKVIERCGYVCPEICSPEELLGGA